MRKMMLLAAAVALAALMLAAAPAFAQPITEINGFRFSPGNCGNLEGTTLTREEAAELLEAEGLDPEELPDAGNVCLLDDGDDGNGNGNGDGDDGDDNGDDDDDRDRRDRDRDRDNVADVVPVVEIDQETEQECESGEVDQSVNVSQTGDNSIQTVGAQPTANTGCAQNALGVIDAGPFVGDFAGDRVFVDDDDDDNGFFDDGRFIRCDRDGDGNNDDDCDDFDNGHVLCDRDNNGHDDGDDDCFVFDHDNGDDDNDNDRVIIRDGDRFNVGDGDLEIEDVNSTIDVSPNQTVTGDSEINQAAAASAPTYNVPPHYWWWA